jgi:NosR/NirI family nitrous oxide reductase transcriptional regulator
MALRRRENTMAIVSPPKSRQSDPIAVTIHLRPPQSTELPGRFAATDPPRGWDLTRIPWVAKIVRNRKFQFALILPNQIIFWLVILSGMAGTIVPGLNFGAAITWYLWFCLVFVMMVVIGRAWCVMCPFGGFGEWIQRRTFWNRKGKPLGLGLKVPEPLARYGFLISVGTFLLLTFIEEFFNISGPGAPINTSWMVLGIVGSALIFFLVFEKRSFCRYFCPLTALVGTVGAVGVAAGFRTKDRDVCLTCETKECMRGGTDGYGCPWYTWPGSAETNLACGLCSECYKGCSHDNVGLFLQKPMTSVIAPTRRRADVAWSVAILWGLVVYQQINATSGYAGLDDWLNTHIGFPRYPDPIAYVGFIAVITLATAGLAGLVGRVFARPDLQLGDRGTGFQQRTSRFRAFFMPIAYGLIPLVGADYFARQLPKFFLFVPRVIVSIGHPFGFGSVHSSLYNESLLTSSGIVIAQLLVIALGFAASMWATWRISGRDLVPISTRPVAVRLSALAIVVVCGGAAAFLYAIMHAAT